MMREALALAAAVVVGGCAVGDARGVTDGEPPVTAGKETRRAELSSEGTRRPVTSGKMGPLCVIDAGGSMYEEQEELRRALPRIVAQLDEYRSARGVALDYRLAVTTTGRDMTYRIRSRVYDEHGDNG